MCSYVFVSVMAPAPPAQWSGDPEEGVVAGKRLQLSRQGAARYIYFWRETVMRRAPDSVDKLLALERDMRKQWADPFRRFRQLQCCILDSIHNYQGVVFASLAYIPRNPDDKGSRGKDVAKGGPKDFSKLPGFDANQPTAKKTSEGKLVCKHFNIPAGCTFGSACKFEHACDVRMPDGSACGSKQHNRLGHKAAQGTASSSGAAAAAAEG